MQSALKIKILIPENRRIEIELPQELPPGPAEMIILAPQERLGKRPLRPIGVDVGKGWVADDFDAPLPEDLQRLFEGAS
jgi:hypothetical protein